MTQSRKGSHRTGKGPRAAFKVVAAAIPLMAATLPIIAAFEHWFGAGPAPASPSTSAEYGAICTLSNERQREKEKQLAHFRVTFEHAHNLTAARDAILLLTKQELAATSELQNRIQALTPSQSQAGAQHQLENDLQTKLTVLWTYRERLGREVASVTQLVKIAGSLPRSAIEAKTAAARGRLLRLGAPACSLDPEREQPITDWAPALRDKLASVSSHNRLGDASSHAFPAAPIALPEAAQHRTTKTPSPGAAEAAAPEVTEAAPPETIEKQVGASPDGTTVHTTTDG